MSVRVLVVDDSPSMRALITATLRRDPDLLVVGQAGDPHEARTAIKALQPDVLTLDVQMPHMNGLDFLERIMRLRPMPVVMVSSLTRSGAEIAVEAMAIGAVACVSKPASGGAGFDTLAEIVKAAGQARVAPCPHAAADAGPGLFTPDGRVLAIGSSTGGVEALLSVLSAFPANCPPTVIAQHMPPGFTASFAARLDRTCAPTVREAVDGAPLQPGTIHVARAGMHLEVAGRLSQRCTLRAGENVNGHQPSVDVLFRSVARVLGPGACVVILTGMGRDGAEGLLAMREAGADTLGQDEASSVIYGMPRAAMEIGAVARQVALPEMGRNILRLMNRSGK